MGSVLGIDGERHLFRQSSDGVVDKTGLRQLRSVKKIIAERETLILDLIIAGVVKSAG